MNEDVSKVTWSEDDDRAPAGLYRAMIGSVRTEEQGPGEVRWSYPLATENQGTIWANFQVHSQSAQRQKISRSQWAQLKRAAGVPEATDAKEIEGKTICFDLSYNGEWPRFKWRSVEEAPGY